MPLPDDPARLAYRPGRKMGSLARRLDQPRILYRGLRPEALATLLYIAKEYRRIAGKAPAAAGHEHRARPPLPGPARRDEHPGDAASSRSTRPASRSTSQAAREAPLRFLLERLQALNAIAWVEEPGAFHLTVGPEAKPSCRYTRRSSEDGAAAPPAAAP